MATPSSTIPTQGRIVWGIRILLALAFGAAGAAKLAGVSQMVQVFDAIGIGQGDVPFAVERGCVTAPGS